MTGVSQQVVTGSLGSTRCEEKKVYYTSCETAVEGIKVSGVHPILGTVQKPVESIQFKISRQTNTGAVVVGICYRGPHKEDEDFLKQLEGASHSQPLVYM